MLSSRAAGLLRRRSAAVLQAACGHQHVRCVALAGGRLVLHSPLCRSTVRLPLLQRLALASLLRLLRLQSALQRQQLGVPV